MEPYKREFYSLHRELNRTLRMESRGVCQLCGRKSERRVEMHSPLWPAGPILYGDCCLPQAETALRPAPFHAPAPPLAVSSRTKPTQKPQTPWLLVVAAGLGVLAIGLEQLLPIKLF